MILYSLESTSTTNLENMIDEVISNKKAESKFKNYTQKNPKAIENNKLEESGSLSDILKKSIDVEDSLSLKFGYNAGK